MPRGLVVGLGEHGSRAAQLILEGQRHGHWVVVDGLVEDHIEVRDPVGLRYRLPWDEFVVLVRNMVVVFEGGK